jgi:hypothetical protein
VLTLLDAEAAAEMPSLVGNEDYLPLDAVGVPCGANAAALNRVLGKAGRYLKRLPEQADKLHAELQVRPP